MLLVNSFALTHEIIHLFLYIEVLGGFFYAKMIFLVFPIVT